MSLRATMLLILVFMLLCAGYFGMLYFQKHTERVVSEARRVFDFEAGDISKITVTQGGIQPTTGERGADGQWRITSPMPLKAYQELWNRMAQRIAEIPIDRTLDADDGTLADYQLQEPRLVITADIKGTEPVKLSFGMASPTQTHRYARIGDGPVVLVKEEYFFELNRSREMLRHAFLYDIPQDKAIKRVEFAWIRTTPESGEGRSQTQESLPVIVERQDSGIWRMLSPVEGPANAEIMASWEKRLRTEVCQDFNDAPEALSDYGLEPPNARLSIYLEGDEPAQTVFFGNPAKDAKNDRMYARYDTDQTVFTLPREFRGFFPPSPDALRDRRIITRSLKTLKSLHLASEGRDFTLDLDAGGKWHFQSASETREADQPAVVEFLNALSRRQGSAFIERVQSGVDTPRATITMTFTDEPQTVELRIGNPAPDGSGMCITQDTGETIVADARAVLALVNLSPYDFLDVRLFSFDEARVTRIAMRFEGQDYLFDKSTGHWAVLAPKDKVWDSPADMEALLDAISPIRSLAKEVVVRPSDLTPYGLDTPVLSIQASIRNEDGTDSVISPISIGTATADNARQRFAVVENRSEVFRVSQSHIDDLRDAMRGLRDNPSPASGGTSP